MYKKLAIVWGFWGPYHYARYSALVQQTASKCYAISLAGGSETYDWEKISTNETEFYTIESDKKEENLNPLIVSYKYAQFLISNKVETVFLPSYWPSVNFCLLITTRLLGRSAIMMNESHALTERAKGLSKIAKRLILKLFHGGFLGGSPQVRHFTNLGMNSANLMTGYDAVDNQYFSQESNKIRANPNFFRKKLGLPKSYILNLGRMVEKKNLDLLVRAYSSLPLLSQSLVLVGSGSEEESLGKLALELGLTVSTLNPGVDPVSHLKTVFFAGFRQIEENPAFYALADAFVLPSHTEEWGLVVNEAMACSLPVLVSKNVGSAEDLVISGENGFTFDPADHNDLATKLELILSTPGLKEKMGAASFSIIQKWGCDNFARQAIRVAERVC